MTKMKELVPTERAERHLARPFAFGWPFGHTFNWADDIERLFENVAWNRGFFPAGVRKELEGALWAPVLEIFEREGQFVVRVELPGVHKENVHVEIDEKRLIIQGERKEEKEEEKEYFLRSERSYGRFYRAVLLPEGVNPETVKASFKDGVLEVTLAAPLAPEMRTRTVKIEEGPAKTATKAAA